MARYIREEFKTHERNKMLVSGLYSHTTSEPMIKKWVIQELIKLDRPFKLLQHGAGVVTITTETNICLKCNGSGRC